MTQLAVRTGIWLAILVAVLLALLVTIATLRDARLGPAFPGDPAINLGLTAQHALLTGPFDALDQAGIGRIRTHMTEATGKVPGFGLQYFKGGKLWLFARVPVLSTDQERLIIRIGDTRVREARLALIRNGNISTFMWRYDDPVRRAGLSNRMPTFAFDKAAIEGADLLVGFNSLGALRGNLHLQTERAALDFDSRQGFSYGIFEGVLAALAIYLLVIGWRMREPSLVFAAGLLFFVGWFLLGVGGYIHAEILAGSPNLADVLLYGTQPVMLTFWMLLVVSYLGVLQRHPRLGLVAVIIALLLPFQGILTLFTALGFPLPFITDNATPVLIGLLGGLGIAIAYAIGGDRRAQRLLACFLPVAIWSFGRVFIYFSPSPDPFLAAVLESYIDLPVTMILLALLVSLDLSIRERALRMAAEINETRFRHFAEIASDSYFEVDMEGTILRADGTVAALHGFAPGRLLNNVLPSMNWPQHASGPPFRNREIMIQDLAGRPRWLSVSLFAGGVEEFSPYGPGGWRGTLTDVTATVERRLQESRQSTLLALGQLASGVAHEVNNLLHPMINLAQRVRDRHAPDEESRKLLELVVASGKHAGEIVAGVLNAFGPAREPRRSIGMPLAVEEALASIRPTLPASMTMLQHIDTSVQLETNPGEMLQVLSNLAANAVRASDGRGVLTVSLARRPGGAVQLVIEDNGPGIPPTILPRVIEPFVTGHENGTGLGLAIVANIVRDWGGTLAIENVLPHGARFTISLTETTVPEGANQRNMP